MTDRLPLIYWDADVYLSYIEDQPDRAPLIELLLEDARVGQIELVTSAISIAEVAFAASERLADRLSIDVERKIDGLWAVGAPTRVVEVYPLIAHRARNLMRQGVENGWALKPHDAIHLATAQQLRADEIHTYDGKWAKFSQFITIPVDAPGANQPRIV
jgi:predicted nucleic acid-binding protein